MSLLNKTVSTEIWLTDELSELMKEINCAHFKQLITQDRKTTDDFFIVLFGKSASYKRAAVKYRDLCNNDLVFLKVKGRVDPRNHSSR